MANSLLIATADYSTGRAQQTTISGINPAAKFDKLATFAAMTVDLSKDSYVKAERIIKDDLDNPKPQRTINPTFPYTNASGTKVWKSITQDGQVFNLNANEVLYNQFRLLVPGSIDNPVFVKNFKYTGDGGTAFNIMQFNGNTWETKINLDTDESCSVEFDIFIPEDDTYAELNWHVTINVTKE